MRIDQFGKLIFLAIIASGCWFWWTKSQTEQTYALEIANLASILDTRPGAAPETDAETAERTFKALTALHSIATDIGKKFDIRATIREATELNNDPHSLAKIITDVTATNYKIAEDFGLLDSHDALWRMQQGSPPVIVLGPWAGEPAEVGYYILPDFLPSLANQLTNRIIVPQSVKALMPVGNFTRDANNWAERLQNAGVLKREFNLSRKTTK